MKLVKFNSLMWNGVVSDKYQIYNFPIAVVGLKTLPGINRATALEGNLFITMQFDYTY